jgi:XisH protein
MSRRDSLHFSVRRTLEKDGWTITDDPLILVLEKTLLKADLGAEKFFTAEKGERKIAVETKDFAVSSVISELEKTMGQLQLYQWALEEQEPERKLFLALSQVIYVKHFRKPIFQLAVRRNRINMLVYDSEQEVILQWITQEAM